jgi:hypothetical protein
MIIDLNRGHKNADKSTETLGKITNRLNLIPLVLRVSFSKYVRHLTISSILLKALSRTK